MKYLCFLGLLVCTIFHTATTAAESPTFEDRLEWSESHGQRTRSNIYRDSIDLQFFGPEERYAWYVVRTGESSRELVLVDNKEKSRQIAVEPQVLATKLSELLGKEIVEQAAVPRSVQFSDDAVAFRFRFEKETWEWNRSSQSLLKLDQAIDGLAKFEGLEPLTYIPRSGSGDSTDIEIYNQTDQVLEVFWVDSGGGRRSYGKIQPDGTFASSTYVTHAWLLVDPDGKEVAAFQAGEWDNRATVTADTPKPERGGRPGRRRSGMQFGDGGNSRNSPDGKFTVFYRDQNVVLMNRESRQEWQLTKDGTEDDEFSGRVWWSPNSRYFVVLKTKRAEQRQVTMVDSAPNDQLQPKLLTINYTKPGDVLDHARPYLFQIDESEETPEHACILVDDSLFPNPFDINRFAWNENSRQFTFVYNQRGHQVLRVIAIDAATGNARAVVDESSETFVCYSQKFFFQHLEATGEVIWMTERDGWNHLVLIDYNTGEVKNKITDGPWVVREVERVDAEQRKVWLKISGIHPQQDPYYQHLASVNFDGSEFRVLTEGDGDHRWRFSPEQNWLIETYSRVDLPTVTTIRDSQTGELVCELERADWSELLATGWSPPERFVAKGRDGETDIYGIIVRPTNFDPTKRYPVLEDIYAGPHDSFTPKTFGRHRNLYEMADMGFIVVKLDGMGTSNRSKAFHDVCWKNLGDSGFPDRIIWMQSAAEMHPEMDLDRVGLYGGSAGGQSALRALLAFGDFYRAAAADCGCHDNRMDKIWWNEQWMGWPVGDHYAEQSNVTQAHKLRGKLLLTVGELDTNVDPASTMQVVDALIRAGKDFEFINFPGAGHGAGSSPYGKRRMKDFFVRALGGPE